MPHYAERMARQMLARAKALDVPTLPTLLPAPPEPGDFARACGIELDPWQRDVIESEAKERILNCSRQSGKSTVTAIEALRQAVYVPGSVILLLSPAQRQSTELALKVEQAYAEASQVLDLPNMEKKSALRMRFDNGSRVLSLPGKTGTVRGYAAHLVIIDEAAQVEDGLIAAVAPMTATTNGRLIVLSTPFGRRGFFHDVWFNVEGKGEGWERTTISAAACPRISKETLDKQRRLLGEFQYLQEYECQFLENDTALFAHDIIESAFVEFAEPFWEDIVA